MFLLIMVLSILFCFVTSVYMCKANNIRQLPKPQRIFSVIFFVVLNVFAVSHLCAAFMFYMLTEKLVVPY